MESKQRIQKDLLLGSVSEAEDILKRQRPDLPASIFSQLDGVRTLLAKEHLSAADLEQSGKTIGYLCHFKCLYDFCPLELSAGETDQERWQRWGRLLDRMKSRCGLLCGGGKPSAAAN